MPRRSYRSHAFRVVLAALAGASAAAVAAGAADFDIMSQIGPNPVLPEPQQFLFPPMHLAPVVGWKQGETPSVAPGLKIEPLVQNLQHPRSVYVLPNGDVLVVESVSPDVQPINRPKDIAMGIIESWVTSGGNTGPSNRITLLHTDDNGKVMTSSVFLDHLNSPFGVALVGNDLYVANTDAIMRYPYHEGDTRMAAPGTKLTDLPGGPIDHHWTKSLVANRDGSLLYVGVGSNSNITENGLQAEKNRAAIWEVDRATGRWRIFASGLRNPNGLTFEPQTGALWTVVNERDEIGPDLVPDYLTSVKDGGFYGWPYSYFGRHVDVRVQPPRPDLVEKAIVPDYALSSHVAPLGLVFYTADNLPQKYRGGAFVGEHGSWNRPQLNGYKVVFVPFTNGRPSGKTEDVVTDFLNQNGEARGRPVGVAVDKTGALLIADDVGNTVWRVTAAAPQQQQPQQQEQPQQQPPPQQQQPAPQRQ
jgi:glucose/arabinose dehydrogenase